MARVIFSTMKNLLLFFVLLCGTGIGISYAQDSTANVVYTKVDQMPQFKGGDAAFRKFIGKHLRYPEAELKAGIHGTVYLSFIVEADGNVKDATVDTGVNPGLDKEALRLIRSMPRWVPGRHQGRPVRVLVDQRISFSLA